MMRQTGWKTRLTGIGSALALLFLVLVLVDSISNRSGLDPDTTGGGIEASADRQERGRVVSSDGATLSVEGGANEAEAESAEQAAKVDDGASGQPRTAVTEADAFEPIRNVQEKFSRFASVPSGQLDLTALTEPADRSSNGASPEGQFRIACEYSHFGYDDPIIFPGEPGRSHLHMFFGNTDVDAFTTEESLLDSGGGTCNGYELNRSAYWIPALLDGRGNAVAPDSIVIYYKTKFPDQAVELPQGLQMIAGNTEAESFEADGQLFWSCGASGSSYNPTNRIPDCGGDVINASIQFPNCWDGVNLGSDDLKSHLTFVDETQPCPGSHPERLPQISMLFYWPGADSVDGWHLSSDRTDSFNAPPGGTLHADWWGGWNDDAIRLWTDGCIRAALNCAGGQTGTPRLLAQLNGANAYQGDNYLPLPAN